MNDEDFDNLVAKFVAGEVNDLHVEIRNVLNNYNNSYCEDDVNEEVLDILYLANQINDNSSPLFINDSSSPLFINDNS